MPIRKHFRLSRREARLSILPGVLLLMGLLAQAAGAADGGLYRWTDAAGNVHYSDQLPPAEPALGHQELRKDGIEKQAWEPQKSREEQLREQEAERERLEQQRLSDKQRAADQLLMGTYRTEDDLLLTRNGKLAAVDSANRVTLSSLQGQKRQLLDLLNQVVRHEQRGQPVPEDVRRRILEAEQTLLTSYAAIVRREQEKEQIYEEFELVLARFRALMPPTPKSGPNSPRGPALPPQGLAELDYVVPCKGLSDCQTLWGRGKSYVEQQANTPLQYQGPRLQMTALPRGDQEVSLTLSWISNPNDSGGVLFLDLQCHASPLGKQHCASPAVEQIRKGFKPFLRQP